MAPPFQPYPPALQQWGIDLSRVLIVRPKNDSEMLWSAEQALSSGTCAAVLLWPDVLDDQASRRLQLAAEKGSSWAIAFRPPSARREPSAAALRLELLANGEGTRVSILKSRGGRLPCYMTCYSSCREHDGTIAPPGSCSISAL